MGAALGASRARSQPSPQRPFLQYLPGPSVAGLGIIRVRDTPEEIPLREIINNFTVTAYSAQGEVLSVRDQLPDGSALQTRKGTYIDLDVAELFGSGPTLPETLAPVLGTTDYFVVSGEKDLQTSYRVEGSGRFSSSRQFGPRSRSRSVFDLWRSYRPVDTNVVMGQDLPEGSRPAFLRSDNAQGGTRLVPGLALEYRASDLIFHYVFSAPRGLSQPFGHGEGEWKSTINIYAAEATTIALGAWDTKGNLLGTAVYEKRQVLRGTPEELFPDITEIHRISYVRATAGARMAGENGLHHIVGGVERAVAFSLAASSLDHGTTLLGTNVFGGDGKWTEFSITNPFDKDQFFVAEAYRVRDAGINGLVEERLGVGNFSIDAKGQIRSSLENLVPGVPPEDVEYVVVKAFIRDDGRPKRMAGMVVVGDENSGTMDAYEMVPTSEPRQITELSTRSVEINDPAPQVEVTVALRGSRTESTGAIHELDADPRLGTDMRVVVPNGSGDRVFYGTAQSDLTFGSNRYSTNGGVQMFPDRLIIGVRGPQGTEDGHLYELPGVTVREEQNYRDIAGSREAVRNNLDVFAELLSRQEVLYQGQVTLTFDQNKRFLTRLVDDTPDTKLVTMGLNDNPFDLTLAGVVQLNLDIGFTDAYHVLAGPEGEIIMDELKELLGVGGSP